MKDIKVLGPGCARCATTVDMVEAEAKKLGIDVQCREGHRLRGYRPIRHCFDARHRHRRQGRACGRATKSADLAKWLQG